MDFEKLFPGDRINKRERVLRILNHEPVDRAAIHEQLSYNGPVVGRILGRPIQGFDYGPAEVGNAIRRTLDTGFPIFERNGTRRERTAEGFVIQHDNWTSWRIARPFTDECGAARWLRARIRSMSQSGLNDHTAVQVEREGSAAGPAVFDADRVREEYRRTMGELQRRVGESVIIDFSFTGFCDLFDAMGLEIFTFFSRDYPSLLQEYLEVAVENELQRVRAVADPALSPVILIPEDFATKHGPIFEPAFLKRYHYPYVRRLAEAWHELGYKVLYHSDGNYLEAIPELTACGVDGFYCLEPGCGMEIVELKARWPGLVWAGGVDGVELMERGSPEQVRREVRRHIRKSGVLETGGMLVATSSEINPLIPPENFLAMVEEVGANPNPAFVSSETAT
ncbi:MAG: hypothetical protein JW820_07345 [Spirochaetales bacterium]|nr:hypothetical protein [Spirochaetales bacterium]